MLNYQRVKYGTYRRYDKHVENLLTVRWGYVFARLGRKSGICSLFCNFHRGRGFANHFDTWMPAKHIQGPVDMLAMLKIHQEAVPSATINGDTIWARTKRMFYKHVWPIFWHTKQWGNRITHPMHMATLRYDTHWYPTTKKMCAYIYI